MDEKIRRGREGAVRPENQARTRRNTMATSIMVPVLLVGIIFAIFLTYSVLGPVVMNFGRFAGRRSLPCPNQNANGVVRFYALGAALGAGYGPPNPHVKKCSLRHPGEECDEACLKNVTF
jgi:hypothetical protein